MKDIKGFEGKYKITENGEIWSYNLYAHKEPKQMKTYLDSKNKYDYINSIVHEAEHVKQAMLAYYDIEDEGENAAYTIAYIATKMLQLIVFD